MPVAVSDQIPRTQFLIGQVEHLTLLSSSGFHLRAFSHVISFTRDNDQGPGSPHPEGIYLPCRSATVNLSRAAVGTQAHLILDGIHLPSQPPLRNINIYRNTVQSSVFVGVSS